MIVAGFMFAAMGVFVKLGATQFDAAELAFYRNFVGLVIVGALVAARLGSLRTTHATAHFMRGFVGSISLIGYFYAMTQLPLATAQTLNYTSPIFLAIAKLHMPYRPSAFTAAHQRRAAPSFTSSKGSYPLVSRIR